MLSQSFSLVLQLRPLFNLMSWHSSCCPASGTAHCLGSYPYQQCKFEQGHSTENKPRVIICRYAATTHAGSCSSSCCRDHARQDECAFQPPQQGPHPARPRRPGSCRRVPSRTGSFSGSFRRRPRRGSSACARCVCVAVRRMQSSCAILPCSLLCCRMSSRVLIACNGAASLAAGSVK